MSYGNSKAIKVRIVTIPEDEWRNQENERDHAETIIQLSDTLKDFTNQEIWYAMTLAGINPSEVAGIANNDINKRFDDISTEIQDCTGSILSKLKKLEKAIAIFSK